MRAKSVAGFVAGSIVVYVLVAACGAGGDKGGPTAPSNDSGGTLLDGSVFDAVREAIGEALDLDSIVSPVPDAEAGPGTDTVYHKGGTRLVPIFRHTTSADGYDARDWAGSIYDVTRGENCNPTLMSDGKMRCAPPATGYTSLFSDASCATPLFVRATIASSCGVAPPTPKYGTVQAGPATCPTGARYFPITGEAVTNPTTVYIVSGTGSCLSQPWPYGTAYKALAIGPEISADAFAEVTTVEEH